MVLLVSEGEVPTLLYTQIRTLLVPILPAKNTMH